MLTRLRRLWQGWLDIAHFIGDFQSRLLLTVFYFTVLAPFGLIVCLSRDLLSIHCRPMATGWNPRETRDVDLVAARRQS